MILPLIIAMIISSVLGGGLISLVGYYTPFMIASSVLTSIGAGLMTTFKVDTGIAKWIPYQVIFGFGFGLGFQQPLIAAQTVLDPADVPIGTAVIVFAQTLGGALFVSVGQNIFTDRLMKGFKTMIPNLDPRIVLSTGATSIQRVVDPKLLPTVKLVYNEALTHTFVIALAVACVSAIGAAGMEWKSVKSRKKSGPD